MFIVGRHLLMGLCLRKVGSIRFAPNVESSTIGVSLMYTQNDMIYKHLIEHGSITSMEAIKEYGITRLAARIYNLKQYGCRFRVEDLQSKNGRKFRRYHLIRKTTKGCE